jgi:flagellum-specific peptidoglycan hydrolase FlgJ
MPPLRHTYLPHETLDLADSMAFDGHLRQAQADVAFHAALPDALGSIWQAAPRPRDEDPFAPLPMPEAAPVVVSERPDAMRTRQQLAQGTSAPLQAGGSAGSGITFGPAATPAADVTLGLPTAPTPGGTTTTPGAAPAGGAPRTAQAATGEIDNSSREAFIRTAYPYALEAADGDPKLANQLVATAISENGKVGTGRSLEEMGYNVGGIQGVTGPAGSFWALDAGNRREFAAYHNLSEGFRAVRDLVSNGSRYQPAAAAYLQSGDIDRYWQMVNEAGYAEDPSWHAKIGSIRRGQVEPLTAGLAAAPQPAAAPPGAPRPSPASAPPHGVPTAVADGPDWKTRWGNDLTPDQIQETLALGMSWDAALATCGVAASVAFARANGRNPTFGEALELAKRTGEWNPDVGMARGSAGQIALLKGLGVDARVVPLNEQTIVSEIGAGRPVQINAQGNGGHYYVASGYNPETRQFYFGNSASILKRSGGRQWFRLDELASLGVGTPAQAILLGAGG